MCKTVPTMDAENDFLPKNRKRSSKNFEEMEETPFTGSYKPTVKSQNDSEENYENPTCLKNTRCYFCDFCDNTSIHGFKFLGERGRYFIEKIWWFLVVSGAIFGSTLLISKAYAKWVTSPVVVTFAMTETPIWEIPFPAVTICPELKANRSIFNFTDVYLKYRHDVNTTAEEDEFFGLFSLTCRAFDNISVDDNETKTITEETLYKFLDAFADLAATDCKWLGVSQKCDDILSPTVTTEGVCTTFNMFEYEDVYSEPEDYIESRTTLKHTKSQKWSLQYGYPAGDGLETFPRRTILTGANAGLEITLRVDDEQLDYLCTELQGFKVTLHHPAEEPDMDKHFLVPLDQAVVVGIRPRMITTSDEIRGYSPQERQCYLPGEKLLSTYKIYTQQNCMTECLTNYTVKKCGCTGFHMPYNGDAEYCGPGSKGCMKEAKVKFLASDVVSKINKSEQDIDQQCACLPACTSLEFDSETSQTEWNWKKNIIVTLDIPELDVAWDSCGIHQSKLIVYYKDMQFMTSERHELYGTVDFLANCGGLLGLFCGFSFTSSMEIFYYLILRLVCNLKKFGGRVWSGTSELVEEEARRKKRNELL